MSSDPFDGVLGRRRGSGLNATDDVSLPPVERARRLMKRLAGPGRPLLQSILIERQQAAELGLELRHGFWSDTDGEERWALCAIYFQDEFIGFSDLSLSEGEWRLLRVD